MDYPDIRTSYSRARARAARVIRPSCAVMSMVKPSPSKNCLAAEKVAGSNSVAIAGIKNE